MNFYRPLTIVHPTRADKRRRILPDSVLPMGWCKAAVEGTVDFSTEILLHAVLPGFGQSGTEEGRS